MDKKEYDEAEIVRLNKKIADKDFPEYDELVDELVQRVENAEAEIQLLKKGLAKLLYNLYIN